MTRAEMLAELRLIQGYTSGTSDAPTAMIYRLAKVVEALVAEPDGEAS